MPDLSGCTTEALWCRGESHSFKWVTDDTTFDTTGKRLIAWVRRMKCVECGATAHRDIDPRTFHAKPRKIDHYPDGYLVKGQGRIPKDDVYKEQFERMAA